MGFHVKMTRDSSKVTHSDPTKVAWFLSFMSRNFANQTDTSRQSL